MLCMHASGGGQTYTRTSWNTANFASLLLSWSMTTSVWIRTTMSVLFALELVSDLSFVVTAEYISIYCCSDYCTLCGIKLKDRLPSKEPRETRYRWHSIGITAEQAALVWACAVKRRWWLGDETKCMEYEVEGPRPRGRPNRTWREVVREDCVSSS